MGISKPSKGVFFVSLIIGVFAILNQWVFKITIPVLSDIANIALLALAFVLLVLGVIFKKL